MHWHTETEESNGCGNRLPDRLESAGLTLFRPIPTEARGQADHTSASASPPALFLTRPSPALDSCVSLCFVQQLYDQTLVGTKIGSEKVSRCAAPHSQPHPRGAPQLRDGDSRPRVTLRQLSSHTRRCARV